jgi:hypothetical protein
MYPSIRRQRPCVPADFHDYSIPVLFPVHYIAIHIRAFADIQTVGIADRHCQRRYGRGLGGGRGVNMGWYINTTCDLCNQDYDNADYQFIHCVDTIAIFVAKRPTISNFLDVNHCVPFFGWICTSNNA